VSDLYKRHIVPCRHRGAEKRIYLVWEGEGDGRRELETAMTVFGETEFESDVAPSEHFQRIVLFLGRCGFKEIRC